MISTAYLRVYQPVECFGAHETERWVANGAGPDPTDRLMTRWLISAAMPPIEAAAAGETAFLRSVDGRTFACPSRTRLRMLVGLLAFRGTMPDEVADAFVPETEAHQAARELSRLTERSGGSRSHILHANWHVPLRWFAAFGDDERFLIEDRQGLRVRYETRLAQAKARLDRAFEVLSTAGVDDEIVDAVIELRGWVGEFADDGLLELDYGSVAGMFTHDELVEDRSAAEVWACLDALAEGNLLKAGRLFSLLTDRWSEVRAREAVN